MKFCRKLTFCAAAALALLLAVSFAGCDTSRADNDPSGITHFTPDDFIQLSQFTVVTSEDENTVAKYVADKNEVTCSISTTTDGKQNTVYYFFSTEECFRHTGEKWEPIAQKDAVDYIDSIAEHTGLLYKRLQKQYIKKTSDHYYAVDSEHFFKEAFRGKYEKFFGKDYEEGDFNNDFDTMAPELFGNIDDYTIALDCTDPAKIVLRIDKKKSSAEPATSNVYTYYDINTTKIDLPPDGQ